MIQNDPLLITLQSPWYVGHAIPQFSMVAGDAAPAAAEPAEAAEGLVSEGWVPSMAGKSYINGGFNGKSSNGGCSIAMGDCQRVCMIGMVEQRVPILTRLRVCCPRKPQKTGQSQKKYEGSKIKKVLNPCMSGWRGKCLGNNCNKLPNREPRWWRQYPTAKKNQHWSEPNHQSWKHN